MLKKVGSGLLIWSLFISVSMADNGFLRCNCEEDEGFWNVENILEAQRVSDFLIAVAYFSIPIELLYFVSCSNVPFKWVLFQFISFIVLCGLTHLLNGWTYGPHPFQIMLLLTIFKFLTALVSCATAITLVTLIPLLLKVKVREIMLREKTWDLGRKVGIIKQQKETGSHVRMLTCEIRKSLDKHTILYTTLVELSKTLKLQNCAIWMPNEDRTEMNLTHELKNRNYYNNPIPMTDLDVISITKNNGVNILSPDSVLGVASCGENGELGSVAAIRMPMLKVSNFKGGTPEFVPTCYAILVLVLPLEHSRRWGDQEFQIVQVVADQVTVALSHAAVLEESQFMREKLAEQNRALQHAQRDAMMASQARSLFHKVMGNEIKAPMHLICVLLAYMQEQGFSTEKQVIVDAMVKSSNVLSALMVDVVENSEKNNGRFLLKVESFKLHSLIKEAASLAKCLCVHKRLEFLLDVEKSLPDLVIGDERRVFQVILHMFGHLLNSKNGRGGCVKFRVFLDGESVGGSGKKWASWKSNLSNGYVHIRFEIAVDNYNSESESMVSAFKHGDENEGLNFNVCQRLAQLMHGNIWSIPSSNDSSHTMALVLRFQLHSSVDPNFSEQEQTSDHPYSKNTLFKGLRVLLATKENLNRSIIQKLLEKLGCTVATVSTESQCLNEIYPSSSSSSFRIVVLDLNISEFDGFKVAMKIRKFCSHNWPLIVGLTENANEELWGKCLQVGINGVVMKPVFLLGIADELRRVLHQAGYWDD